MSVVSRIKYLTVLEPSLEWILGVLRSSIDTKRRVEFLGINVNREVGLPSTGWTHGGTHPLATGLPVLCRLKGHEIAGLL